MEDIHSFYQERATIEKEYSQRLTALSSKYYEKKARMSTILSVGDTPVITPGSLESASLVTWSEILNQTELLGKERLRLSNEFGLQISDQVHGVGVKFEDLRRRFSIYHDKLLEDRDIFYGDFKKSKVNYDTACQAMENTRLKASKAASDKANRKLQEREVEMNNEKNLYLIKINVANRIKDKYYHEDVPELLDQMQGLNEARVQMLNHFWNQAIEMEQGCYDRSKSCLTDMSSVVAQNEPALDSAMFVKHNIAQWTEPTDFFYQPSPIWHDDEKMMTDSVSLQYLRKRLGDAQSKLAEHERSSRARIEAYTAAQEQKKTASADLAAGKISRGSYLEFLGRSLSALQALAYNETAKTIQEVEVETIEVAAGDKDLNSVTPIAESKKRRGLFGIMGKFGEGVGNTGSNSSNSHNLHPVTSASTMGTSKSAKSSNFDDQGKHKGGFLSSFRRSKSKKGQQGSGNGAMGADNSSTSSSHQGPRVKMLYAYAGDGDGELGARDGEELSVVEADDGSGWLTVRNSSGAEGLVPASYTEELQAPIAPVASIASVSTTNTIATGDSRNPNNNNNNSTGNKKRGPAVAPKRGAKKVNYMIALYNYDATTEDEISIQAGDKIAVVGEDVGDGWTEGEINGMRGSFPTAYARSA